MRYLFFWLATASVLFGFAESVNTFQAAFEQRIVDENGESVTYRGTLSAERPDRAYWRYDTPVVKEIYIVSDEVIVVEPDMEQAIIRRMQEDIDFFSILANARKIAEERYEATYDSQRFTITTEAGSVSSIAYRDSFDNRIELKFSEQVINAKIPPETFRANIPASFDIVR